MQVTLENKPTTVSTGRIVYLAHALTPDQNAGLVALHFITMYLELSIYSDGSLLFPYAGSTVLAVIGAILNRSAIKSTHLSLLASVIFTVAAASLVAATSGKIVVDEFLRSFAQFVAALISAYCIFVVIVLSSRQRLIWLLSLLLTTIMIGALLESLPPVRAFSDSFRALIYPESLLYSADQRDIATYGAVRPRFLTREPSVVGIGAGLLIAMIFLLSKARMIFRIVGAAVVALLCIVIMRSPTIIFFAGIVFYGAISLRPTQAARSAWVWAVMLTAVIIVISFALTYETAIMQGSSRSIFAGGSYVLRVFGPPLIWLGTLNDYALFGLGLGSFDALLPIAREAYGSYGILSMFPYLRGERDGAVLITNGFWEYWIFFGLLGGSLIIIFLYRLFRAFGLLFASFPFFATLLALQTFGGISAYRPWHMLFVFAAMALVVQRGYTEIQGSDKSD